MGRPLFCATVVEPTLRRALAVARGADPRADLVEIRLDALDDPSPEPFLARLNRTLVFTCRPESQGGRFLGAEEERIAVLRRAIDAGAAWIDVELEAAGRIGDRGRARLVVSYHDLTSTPLDLEELRSRVLDRGPDIAKVVTRAEKTEDALRVLDLLRSSRSPLAAHSLGPPGIATRVLGAKLGSAIVYGAARPGSEGAPGQPTLRSLLDDYRLDRDLAKLRPVVLFGASLDHSISPRMLNGAFAEAGTPGLYVPWPVPDAAEIPEVIDAIGAAGGAVTVPHKEAVHGLLSREAGGPPGAVNTITSRNGRLIGENTDTAGALGAIRRELSDLRGRRAVVVGAGGAARAAVEGLRRSGCAVTVVNRTRDRAEALAADLDAGTGGFSDLDPEGIDLIVNATPVGQWPHMDETPVPAELFRRGQAVLDMVYNPRRTRLLREAERASCRTVEGVEMLSRQAALQVDRWFGVQLPLTSLLERAREAVDRLTGRILIIGPRGAGKTTVGAILAERLGRSFLDLDDAVEAHAARSIREIFDEEGEPAFRKRELRALEQGLEKNAAVISCGAGVIESAPAVEAIRERATSVILLTAARDRLAERVRDSSRPPLTGLPLHEELREISARRDPVYRALAECVIDTTNITPDEVADVAVSALGF